MKNLTLIVLILFSFVNCGEEQGQNLGMYQAGLSFPKDDYLFHKVMIKAKGWADEYAVWGDGLYSGDFIGKVWWAVMLPVNANNWVAEDSGNITTQAFNFGSVTLMDAPFFLVVFADEGASEVLSVFMNIVSTCGGDLKGLQIYDYRVDYYDFSANEENQYNSTSRKFERIRVVNRDQIVFNF